jgi:hypothetical protein
MNSTQLYYFVLVTPRRCSTQFHTPPTTTCPTPSTSIYRRKVRVFPWASRSSTTVDWATVYAPADRRPQDLCSRSIDPRIVKARSPSRRSYSNSSPTTPSINRSRCLHRKPSYHAAAYVVYMVSRRRTTYRTITHNARAARHSRSRRRRSASKISRKISDLTPIWRAHSKTTDVTMNKNDRNSRST